MASPAPATIRSPLLYIGVFSPGPDSISPLARTYLEIRRGQIIADARLFNPTCGIFRYCADAEGMRILAIKVHDMFLNHRRGLWTEAIHSFYAACSDAELAYEKYIKRKERVEGGPIELKLLNEQEAKIAIAALEGRNLQSEINDGHNEIEKERKAANEDARNSTMRGCTELMIYNNALMQKPISNISSMANEISEVLHLMDLRTREVASKLSPAVANCNKAIEELRTVILDLNNAFSPKGNA